MMITIYVHMCRNIDRHSSHDYYDVEPVEPRDRPHSDAIPRWFPSHARPLRDIQSHIIRFIGVRGVTIHDYVSRRRVTTNARES